MGYPILSVIGFAAPAELGSAMETLCGHDGLPHSERHRLCGAGGARVCHGDPLRPGANLLDKEVETEQTDSSICCF